MVKGRFNWYAYLSFFFIFIFLCISIYLLINPQLILKSKAGLNSSAAFVGLIILVLTAFLFYVVAKVIYFVTIDTDTISIKGVFKKKQISYSEIKSINLFSIENLYLSTGSMTIGIRIELENDKKFIIADPFYSNIDKLKLALSENFKEKIMPYYTQKAERLSQTDFEDDFEKYAGNPITSFNGILFIGVILMLLLIPINNRQNLQPAHFFLITPIIMFYLGLGWQLNYFLISNKRLIVKNHFLFWTNREFDIRNIIVVNFEHPHKRSMALRITTKDFKSKMFSAGSLRDRHWIQIKEKLERSGITTI